MEDTYPGTDLIKRICGSADCREPIESIDEMWVDVDANLVLCGDCRHDALDWYRSHDEWLQCIVPASKLIDSGNTAIINDLEEG